MNGLPPLVRAALGALLVGIGASIMLSAARAARPCVNCGEDSEEAILGNIDKIAAASAEMNGDDAA